MGTCNWSRVKGLLLENDAIRGWIENAENAERAIMYFAMMAYYLESNVGGESPVGNGSGNEVSFLHHNDVAYIGKPYFRTNITMLHRPQGCAPKTTLLQNRKPTGPYAGEHVEIVCLHGTFFTMGMLLSGASDNTIEHSIWNGRFTITATLDHGERSHALTMEELEAAHATHLGDDNNDEEEEEEEGNEDSDEE